MEVVLRFMMNIVVLGLAGVVVLAAIAIALGNVKVFGHPLARIVITPILSVLALWILLQGIQHMVSG